MEGKFNLFKKEPRYVFNKKKEDFEYFSLTTGTAQNLNNPTGSLVSEINSTDAYLDLPNTCVVAKIKIHVDADKNIAVENNFFPFMFNQIILQLNGNALQTSDEPGENDTNYKLLMFDKNYKETQGCFDGWYPDTHSGSFVSNLTVADPATHEQLTAVVNRLNNVSVNKGYQYRRKYFTPKAGADANGDNYFYIKFPLRPLFSFMDHEAFSSQLKWSFKFVKDINIGRLFFGATGSVNNDVTLTIEDFKLQIPKITPSVHIEPSLIKQITSDKKAKVAVLDRKSYSRTIGNESVFNWEISKVSNNPRYVTIHFKDTQIADNILQNNSQYVVYRDNNNHIRSVQLIVDNVRYPIDPMIFAEEDGTQNRQQGFEYYSKLTQSFGNLSPIDIDDYYKLYPIICFDLSACEEILKKTGVNVTLNIKKRGLNNLIARAFVFEDNVYHIDYKAGRIIAEN